MKYDFVFSFRATLLFLDFVLLYVICVHLALMSTKYEQRQQKTRSVSTLSCLFQQKVIVHYLVFTNFNRKPASVIFEAKSGTFAFLICILVRILAHYVILQVYFFSNQTLKKVVQFFFPIRKTLLLM